MAKIYACIHNLRDENEATVELKKKTEKPQSIEDNRKCTDAEQCDKNKNSSDDVTNTSPAIPDVLLNEDAVTQQQNNNKNGKNKKNKKKGKNDVGSDEQVTSSTEAMKV